MIFAAMRDLSIWAQAVTPPNLPWLPSQLVAKMMARSNIPTPTICSYWPTAEEATVTRTRLWKHQLQVSLWPIASSFVSRCAIIPPGASKWNPIEHRMFSFISNNWAAHPLTDYETVLKFIRTTKTSAGLKIRAALHTKQYQKGIRICDEQMKKLI
jgi:hypothetical protein